MATLHRRHVCIAYLPHINRSKIICTLTGVEKGSVVRFMPRSTVTQYCLGTPFKIAVNAFLYLTYCFRLTTIVLKELSEQLELVLTKPNLRRLI